MKRFLLLLVLVAVSNSFAITGFSYFWTPKAKDTVTAAKLKANYDTTRLWAQRICDTLNNNKVPFSGAKLHDSVFSYIRLDTIRNSPDIDTLLGVRRIGGAPKIDSIRGPVIIDTSKLDTTTIRAVGGYEKVDSLHVVNGIGGTTRIDSATISKGVGGKTKIDSVKFKNGSSYLDAYVDTTFPCSLYTGASYLSTGTARAIIIGKQVTLFIPALSGTIVSGIATVHVPTRIKPTSSSEFIAHLYNNSNDIVGMILLYPSSTDWVQLVQVSGYANLDAGTGGLRASTITYLK